MVRFLIYRPVAVLMTTAALLIFSLMAVRELPVSLLPDTDVPEIIIKVQYPNASPESIERNILKPIRESMQTLNGLQAMESKAASESGQLTLYFDFDQPMDLRYVEINEKIDRLSSHFPRNMERPLVIRLNASDIPIIKLQLVPKVAAQYQGASELAEAVIKKRIEQLEGISLVDINGLSRRNISITPDEKTMVALGISDSDLLQAIQAANRELGAISVKDGQYRYYLRMANRISSAEDIRKLPIRLGEHDFIPLSRIASVEDATGKTNAIHLYKNNEALVMNIHKQSQARMNTVIPLVYDAVEQFQKDFPEIDFSLTQDQSVILNTGIDNLTTSLLWGGSFAFLVLFLFMRNYRTPIIMGISLPLSLLISFLFFRWIGISVNIISLSGLALGIGMLIDNSIIVLDNIARKKQAGLPLTEACIAGVNEIMGALISSVLTTLAVFVPLVFLSGITGALFYDQAVAVAVILGVSLMVAFIILPLLYRLFFDNMEKNNTERGFYLWMEKGYNRLFEILFRNPYRSFFTLFLCIPIALWLGTNLDTKGMPDVEKFDLLAKLDWNEPISVEESKRRILELKEILALREQNDELDIGLTQFILQADERSLQELSWYMLFEDHASRNQASYRISEFFQSKYPDSRLLIGPAPNAFDQIFSSKQAAMSVRWRQSRSDQAITVDMIMQQADAIPIEGKYPGESMELLSSLTIEPDYEQMRRLGIGFDQFVDKINRMFSEYVITDINASDYTIPVQLTMAEQDIKSSLNNAFLQNENGERYPVSALTKLSFDQGFKFITADVSGPYHAINIPASTPDDLFPALNHWAKAQNVLFELTGSYFSDLETIRQLIYILIIAIVLLYFILAAQFENFIQPLIIISTLPLGLGGAFALLWLSGESLNIMSGIGLVVMLGIIVNDSILKIDIINRSLHQKTTGGPVDRQALKEAIHEGGIVRLKPIIMTSITTILALLPLLFASGLGADLQKPLVITVLGGLTIGTLSSLYFVPLAYWVVKSRKIKA